MKLTDLRVNHVREPLGLFLEAPVFSWVTRDTESKQQAAARITVEEGGELPFMTPAGGRTCPPWGASCPWP